jgi:hypothetical protein
MMRSMRMVAAGIVMAIYSGCVATSSNEITQSRKSDPAATVAYLHARNELLHESMAALPAGRAAMERYVADVRAECGGILRQAPVPRRLVPVRGIKDLVARHLALEQDAFLSQLIEGEPLERAQRMPQFAAARQFAARIATMRWSDPAVTDLVHGYARIEDGVLRSQPQNMCTTAREWVKGGYGLPPKLAHREFSQSVGKMWVRADRILKCGPPMEGSVLAALRPYQSPTAPVTTRLVELMELRLLFAERSARVTAERGLVDALGLKTSPIYEAGYSRGGAWSTEIWNPYATRASRVGLCVNLKWINANGRQVKAGKCFTLSLEGFLEEPS